MTVLDFHNSPPPQAILEVTFYPLLKGGMVINIINDNDPKGIYCLPSSLKANIKKTNTHRVNVSSIKVYPITSSSASLAVILSFLAKPNIREYTLL